MQVIPKVNLDRYQGTWYEITRLPNSFEEDCVKNVTSKYSLNSDGNLDVLNTCKKKDGTIKDLTGTAEVADKTGENTKLEITFVWPFSGDYWIFDLDPDYKRVLVGSPSRKYLWILSRGPELDKKTTDDLITEAKAKGFDTSKLIRSTH